MPAAGAMPSLLRALVLLCACAMAQCLAAPVWLATPTRVLQYDVASGEQRQQREVSGVRQLAATSDGGAWALAGDALVRIGTSEVATLSIAIGDMGYGAPALLASDPYDHGAWVVTSRDLLAHFAADGRLLGGYTLPGAASALGVALDQTVWVRGDDRLWHFSPVPELMATIDLARSRAGPHVAFAVDSLADRIWLAGARAVSVVPAARHMARSATALVDADILGIALDPGSGTLWVLTTSGLRAYDPGLRQSASIDLQAVDAEGARSVHFDHATGRLVLTVPAGLRLIDRAGKLAGAVDVADAIVVAVTVPFHLLPTASLLHPADDAATFDRLTAFTLQLGSLCSGFPCTPPPDYPDSVRWIASLNGASIADLFHFDPATNRSTFVPAMPLAVGVNDFSAQPVDRFGHRGNAIDVQLTVLDTGHKSILEKAGNQAPTVALTAPVNNARFVPGANITLAATAADADGSIARVDFYRGSTSIGTARAAPYTVVWANVPAGVHSLTAKATDNKGGTRTSSAVAIAVAAPPNVPPAVVITSPAERATVNGPDVTIAAAASDTDGKVVRIDFHEGSTLLGSVAGGAAAVNATWTAANVAAGVHSFKATATDDAGATASAVISVGVNAAPFVVLTSPVNCSELTAPSGLTLRADALDVDGSVTRVEFHQNGALVGVATRSPYAFFLPDVPLGAHSFKAIAVDNLGARRASSPVTVSLVPPSNQPPIVALTAPSPGAILLPSTTVNVAATASDPDGTIAKVEFYVGTAGANPSQLIGVSTNVPYAAAWNVSLPGAYVLKAVAVDNLGGRGSSEIVAVNVDMPPTVEILSPANNSNVAAGTTLTVSIRAADSDSSLATVSLLRNGASIASSQVPAGSSNHRLDVNMTAAPGVWTFTAQATDSKGATATSSPATVTVNNVPAVTLLEPLNEYNFAAPATINLAARATQAIGAISKVEFYAGTTLIGTATAVPYTAKWSNVPPGTYAITAKATDNLGSTGRSAVATITVEALALNIVTPVAFGSFHEKNIVVAGNFGGGQVTGVAVNGIAATLGAGTFAAMIPLVEGTNTITVVADIGGTTVTRTTFANYSASAVIFRNASDGLVVHDDSMMLHGLATAPPNSRVFVNGQAAAMDDYGNYFVNNVALASGDNTLAVVVNLQDGTTLQRTVRVKSDAVAPFTFDVSPDTGMTAPHTVTLTVKNRAAVPYRKIDFLFDSTTKYTVVEPAFPEAGPGLVLQTTFSNPGMHTIRVQVWSADGTNDFSATRMVFVDQPGNLDAKLRGIYTGLLDRLRAGSIDSAAYAFTGTVREQYRDVFVRFGPALARAVDSLGRIAESTMSEHYATLFVLRDQADGTYAYPLLYIRDEDGLWRIESM